MGTLTGDFWTNVGKLCTEQVGTVSSVAIAIGGDEDTGFYAPSSDEIAFAVSGVQKILFADGATSSDRGLYVQTAPTDTTAGVRQGAVGISSNRTSSYAWATWDGNPDCGLKIQVVNRSVSGSNGGVRGIDINARNRDSGSLSWIHGAYITAEHSDGTAATEVVAMELHPKNNGVCNGNVKGLRIFDESQSATGTTYALEIDCTSNSAFTREFCIYINTQGSSAWTNGITFDGNVTNALDFVDSDGTNGATYSAGHYGTLGAIDGKIQIDLGGNTLYLPCYVSIAA